MARTNKTKKTKNDGKTARDADKELEAAEETREDVPEPETVEQAQEVHQETVAAGQDQENQEPEPEEEDQVQEVPVKTSPEEAAAIAAQIEKVGVGKLETGESRGGKEAATEQDIFANLPNPCVYCGPSVRGVARQYTTYQGGIHNAMREFIRKHPAALGLIVSTGNFPEMRKRLERQGTPEAKLYKAIKAEL